MNATSRSLLHPIDLTPQKFTTYQKIGIALALIFTLGALLAIGVGAAGHLKIEALAHLSKTHSIIMMGSGAGGILLIGGIGGLSYYITRPPLAIRSPNSRTQKEWELFLGHIETQSTNFSRDTRHTQEQCPTFGTYKAYGRTIIPTPDLHVSLPVSQLSAFPQKIQDLFKHDIEIELYIFIYSDYNNRSEHRNLILHFMALPEFDKTQHSWLQCDAEVGIYDPQGIKPASKAAIPFESTDDFKVILHGDCVSPNNCIFKIDQDTPTSSFYTAARFRNRNVAFYTVLLRDPESPESQIIENAVAQTDCVHLLQQEGSPCAKEFKKLFAYYP